MNTPRQLKKDIKILNVLNDYFNNTDVCQYILYTLKYIEEIEKIETYNYHMDRWNNIAGSFFKIKDSHQNHFSHIWDDINYIIIKDHKPDFFNYTGISYQVVDLIHELINKSYDKKYLYYEDKLYGKLASKIMVEMNKSKN